MRFIDIKLNPRDEHNSRRFTATITKETLDRDGDIIMIDGLDIQSYLSNPIVLFNHDHDEPIARCTRLEVKESTIDAEFEFPPEGTIRACDEYYNKVKFGILNAISIGFFVKAAKPHDFGGYYITESELAEFSIVTVPSNREALIKASKDVINNKEAVDTSSEEEAKPGLSLKQKMRLSLLKIK